MEELASHVVAPPRLGGQRQTDVRDHRDLDRITKVPGNPATIVGCPNRKKIV